MITKEASQKIKNMGLVCACLVVGIHVDFPMIDDKLSAGWFMSNLFVEGIARIAVPFFFVVSGYFFAGHLDENGWWKREVRKRLRSLVVPYYIWVAIAIVVYAGGIFGSILITLALRKWFPRFSMLIFGGR